MVAGRLALLITSGGANGGATRLIATDLPSMPRRLASRPRSVRAKVFEARNGPRRPRDLEGDPRASDVHSKSRAKTLPSKTAFATARAGRQVILVGIPADDRTSFNASTARAQRLDTIKMVRADEAYLSARDSPESKVAQWMCAASREHDRFPRRPGQHRHSHWRRGVRVSE